MPSEPSWLGDIRIIAKKLEAPGPPLLDRPYIERLFGVRRRTAIRIMGKVGGYKTGKTYHVWRDELRRRLDELANTKPAKLARERKLRTLEDQERIDKEHAARLTELPGTSEVEKHRAPDLPLTIRLAAPGELRITFSNLEDLVAQITQFAAAVLNDHETMREIFERSS
ncbi:MAG: hypothetical protein ACRD22_05980 [Terriglobia bacterium]